MVRVFVGLVVRVFVGLVVRVFVGLVVRVFVGLVVRVSMGLVVGSRSVPPVGVSVGPVPLIGPVGVSVKLIGDSYRVGGFGHLPQLSLQDLRSFLPLTFFLH